MLIQLQPQHLTILELELELFAINIFSHWQQIIDVYRKFIKFPAKISKYPAKTSVFCHSFTKSDATRTNKLLVHVGKNAATCTSKNAFK